MVELLKNDALEAVKSPKEVKKYKPAKPIEAPKEDLPDFDKDNPTVEEMFGNNPDLAWSVLAELSMYSRKGEWSAMYDKKNWHLEINHKGGKKYMEDIDTKKLWINSFDAFNLNGTYSITTKRETVENGALVTKDSVDKFTLEGQYLLDFTKEKNGKKEQYYLIVKDINQDGTLKVRYTVSRGDNILSWWFNTTSLSWAIAQLVNK